MSDSEEAREAAKSKPPKSLSDPLSGTRDIPKIPLSKAKTDASKLSASASGGSGGSKVSGSSGGGLGGSSGSSMSSPPFVPGPPADRDDADPEDAVGMRKALRQMGIRPPRAFDPKKDRNFESWLTRIVSLRGNQMPCGG